MKPDAPLPLIDRLRLCAALWTEANGATLARLGRSAVNDGGFFTRLENQVQGTTTASLERFARFMLDPANWPDGGVPEEVVAFGHAVGVTPPAGDLSAGKDGEISPQRDAA